MPPDTGATGVLLVISLFAAVLMAHLRVNRLGERQRALSEQHEANRRVTEEISRRLDEIRRTGEQQTQLLHMLIEGHVRPRRD